MPKSSRSIIIDTPPEVLYNVIVDYPKYAEFQRDSRGAKVLKREGNIAEVEFNIHVVKDFSYVLKMTETPYSKVEWERLRGAFKHNSGSWVLEKIGDEKTKATYNVDIDFGIFVPGFILKTLLDVSLPNMLNDFKKRAEQIYQASKKNG